MLFSPKRWPFKWYAGGGILAFVVLIWLVWPVSEETGLPQALPTPTGPSSAEGVAGSAGPTVASPVPVLETPPIPVSVPATPTAGTVPVEGKIGKPQPLTENVVITPVTPMALQQNLSHLPTQTTKP